ncbi:unnamed protein product [Medioppia subpectinata]|uniref:Uncharacterized protein n=1 Tax=Medioppia subpectinata TaxID=1979941 RepID=A0A7R9KG01_9ACAR|nr:unnamed protein product [Medioppia subpectinata]CAG2102676.1 unnamed protein product [Medioppia subpectinata]
MNALIAVVMIIGCQVLVSDGNIIEDYRDLCGYHYNFGDRIYPLLQRIRANHKDSDHSEGFHLTPDACRALVPGGHDFAATTVYLSDDDHYLYEYISCKSVRNLSGNGVLELSFGGQPFTRSAHLFILWIKLLSPFAVTTGGHRFAINGTVAMISPDETDKQVLMKDLNFDPKVVTLEISTDPLLDSQSFSVKNSYLISCRIRTLNTYGSNKYCKPVEDNERIRCECRQLEDDYYHMYFVVTFWALAMIVAFKPLVTLLLTPDSHEKTVFHQTINCSPKSCSYQYCYVLRLAKESMDTILTGVTIDIEFFTTDHQSVAPQLRFLANVLDKRPVVDLLIYQWRLTALPPLKTVECRHSGDDLKIVLLSISVHCVLGERVPGVDYKIQKNIVRYVRRFRLIPAGQPLDDIEDTPLKAHIGYNEVTLSTLEVIWLLFANISFVALIATFVQHVSVSHTLLSRMGVQFAALTVAAVAAQTLVIGVYKSLLLGELTQQRRLQSVFEKRFHYSIIAYYVAISVCAVSAGIYICLLAEPFDQTYGWFCLTVAASGVMCLLWVFCHHFCGSLSSKPKPNGSVSELTYNSTSVSSES